jgi:hypothetical protein
MSQSTESYKKVHYELRPAKQVERRMLIDALLSLAVAGFPIQTYKYTGMGSIYFIDFMLFHRFLGITDMLSVEFDTQIPKRIEFNKPFDCVKTKICPIGDVIPTLSKDVSHFLWLDYDSVLTKSHLDDISQSTTFLSKGSILLVTIDVEPPPETEDPQEWKDYFEEEASAFLDPCFKVEDFVKSLLPQRNIEIIANAMKSGIAGRPEVEFIPLFNFIYKDGHEMLTMGGMIGGPEEKRKIRSSILADSKYYRGSFDKPPCIITVPKLTRKERQYLDGFMPTKDGWTPKDFELSKESVEDYRDIYRFCPNYAEMLL